MSGPKQSARYPRFAPGDYVVYKGHGVGQVRAIETTLIAGHSLEVIIIAFDQDGMVLRVPFHKVGSTGLRSVATRSTMREALLHLVGPAEPGIGIWNRRMVEYTAKLNSGDLFAVTEVVRDLHRPAPGKSRSPGAQMIYERAFDRLSDELAAVEQTDTATATAKLGLLLNAA